MKMFMENGKQYRRYNYEFVKKRSDVEGGGEYTLLSTEYKTRKDKLLWIHHKCNKTFLMDADGFFNRHNRCPHCRGGHKLSQEEFIDVVKSKPNGDEYEILSQYTQTHEKVTFRHTICGNKFDMRPNNFLIKGNRCPYCAKVTIAENFTFGACHSKSEDQIKDWLDKNSIRYEREVKFPETGRLRFDFKVYHKDDSFVLVEFDGRFHRPPNPGCSESALKKYECQKKNDERKTKFCTDNNITLIRSTNVKTMLIKLSKEFNDYPIGGEIPQQE